MFIEKFVVIFTATILMIYLANRFIKRYAPENLIILPLLAISLSIYIRFAISGIYIPFYLQIAILFFTIIVPSIAVLLQYNNIIVSRKLLYYKMKLEFYYKNYLKTIGIIEKLVKIEGRKSEYLNILGHCYKHQNDFINSRDSFALAIELDRNDYKSYYELGLILDETNKKETAMVMFDKALKIKPDFYEAEEALGICLTSQGRFADAANIYRKALKQHPESYELYYNIAIIEMELGEYDKAEDAFDKAAKIKPELFTAFYNIGNLNYLKGDYDKAIDAYKRILNSSNYSPKGYYKLAIVYAAKKEYEKAMTSLEYAIELDPKYIKEAENELVFSSIKERIDKYLEDKKYLESKKREKRNYMKDKFKIFSKKNEEEKLEEISDDETKEKVI